MLELVAVGNELGHRKGCKICDKVHGPSSLLEVRLYGSRLQRETGVSRVLQYLGSKPYVLAG